MNIRGRAPLHTNSIINLYTLLKEALDDPGAFTTDVDFCAALRSQGALAKYANLEKGINPSSINTLKRIADREIDGGYLAFDAARKNVQAALDNYVSREKQANKSTKQGLRAKVEELEIQLHSAHLGMWQLTKALNESIQNSRSYAESSQDPSIVARCKKEQRKLLKVLSLFVHPMGERGVNDEA